MTRERAARWMSVLAIGLGLGCGEILGLRDGTPAASGAGGSAGSGGSAGGAAGAAGQGATSGGGGAAGSGGSAGVTTGGAAGQAGSGGALAGQGGALVLGPDDLVLDTFPAGLSGILLPYEDQRRAVLLQLLAGLDSDVLCLEEANRTSDKKAVIDAAAMGKLTHAVAFPTTIATPIDDPTDVNGATQIPTGPSCGGAEAPKLDALLNCLKNNCSTIPGSDAGKIADINCVAMKCSVEAAGFVVNATVADKTCFGCLTPQLTSETFGDIANSCKTATTPGLGFSGQNGIIMLSKHELLDPKLYVFPSTWFRRVAIKASIAVGGGQGRLDIYCTSFSSIAHDELFYAYTGVFGAGVSTNGWENENYLHATKLISFVNATSGSNRAVIMGVLASPGITDAGGVVVSKPDGASSIDLLRATFPSALAAGYAPACTACPDNPLFTGAEAPKYTPEWPDHILLKGIPVAAVRDTTRTFTASVVDVTDPMGQPKKVPLSLHYGLRAVVTVP